MALKDIIGGIDDSEIAKINVDKWHDKEGKPLDLYVRSWSGSDRATYERDIAKDPESSVMRAVCLCLVDSEGSPIYNYPKDLPLLGKKNMKVLWKIFAEINKLLFITADEVESLKKTDGPAVSDVSDATV